MNQKNEWAYSEKLKEHFKNPRNVLGDAEDIATYDGRGKVGNIGCGDEMLVVIKVDRKREVITDCKWRTYGCASAIASTSLLSELVKGRTLDEAYDFSPKDIARELGGLPEHKIHCSVLGDKALRAAINDYYRRSGLEKRVKPEKARVVCKCMNVTEAEIEQAVVDGVRTYRGLQEHTKLGTVCGQCQQEAASLLQDYIRKHTL